MKHHCTKCSIVSLNVVTNPLWSGALALVRRLCSGLPRLCSGLLPSRSWGQISFGSRQEFGSHPFHCLREYLVQFNLMRYKSGLKPSSFFIMIRGLIQNSFELLNLRALKFSPVNKMHIFQCMGKIFCVEFQRGPLKFHTKYLAHTLKM